MIENHVSFPSIGGLHNVVRTFAEVPQYFPEQTIYRGKVKLHGTNMGVRVTKDRVVAQGRNVDLSASDRGSGFWDFVQENEAYFRSMWDGIDFVVFGEWCGPGIQKKTAVNKIPEKVFAVFMIQDGPSDSEETLCIYDPAAITRFILPHPRVFILPWWGDTITVEWANRDSLVEAAEKASDAVKIVEACDPWVKENFGEEGIGEGLVYYPLGIVKRSWIGTHIFKAKGLEHKVTKTDKIVEVDPVLVASVAEFVTMFVTEARLEQGLDAVGGNANPRLTGDFLKWFNQDVLKESKDELEVSGLEWSQVAKAVGQAARDWWLARANAI